jgi:hypothetical protein
VLRHGFNTGGVLLPSQRTARRVSPQPNRLSYTDVDFTWKDYRDHGKSKVMAPRRRIHAAVPEVYRAHPPYRRDRRKFWGNAATAIDGYGSLSGLNLFPKSEPSLPLYNWLRVWAGFGRG